VPVDVVVPVALARMDEVTANAEVARALASGIGGTWCVSPSLCVHAHQRG